MLPEVGGSELLLIAVIALIVVGPKDLPQLMRKVGQAMARMRGMAAEFRASFDEMARQSELEELRKEVEAMRAERLDPVRLTEEAFGYEPPVMQSLPAGPDAEAEFDAVAAHASLVEAYAAEEPVGEPIASTEPTLFDLDAPPVPTTSQAKSPDIADGTRP